ncbi:UNVERIFIED_CONTAM: lysine-N-methylase [Acetivibrio alkalicellulosi]
MNNNRKILAPDYYNKFICDGSKCEDNCCLGNWNIWVDEEHYKKLNKVNNINIKEKIQKYIKRNRSNPSKNTYARLKQDKELGKCAFLTEEKMCSMQLELGAEYLCDVCMIYPRYHNRINEELEKSISVSCPLAAELILLNEKGIDIVVIEEGKSIRTSIYKSNEAIISKNNIGALKYLNEIRVFSMRLIKSREYKVWERLTILGLFVNKLDLIVKEKKAENIPKLIENFKHLLTNGGFEESLSQIPYQAHVQIKLLKELIDERFFRGIHSLRYMNCYTEFLVGLGYVRDEDQNMDLENILMNYDNAFQQYYNPFMESREYILENYLVNHIFKEVFPFSNKETIFDNFVLMVIQYSFIKMLLIGMAGYHKENFGEQHVVKLIQSFSKVIEHSDTFKTHLIELLKNNGFNTMAYMTLLLKQRDVSMSRCQGDGSFDNIDYIKGFLCFDGNKQ